MAMPVLLPDERLESRKYTRRLSASMFFLYFLSQCRLKVRRRGFVPFEAWPHQVELGKLFQAGESVVILKARQLGVSWVIAAYVLWTALYRPHAMVLLISMDQKTSDELLNKVFSMWMTLHPWLIPYVKVQAKDGSRPLFDRKGEPIMETELLQLTKHNRSKPGLMEFSNGSTIMALPSTEDAGRSFTADLVVVDEAGFHPYADANFDAYEPTLDGGGQLIICSTANGPYGFFHDTYQDAAKKLSDLVAVFIPWWSRPDRAELERDEDGEPILDAHGQPLLKPSTSWFERARNRYRRAKAKFRQEYPGTAAEAFVASTGLVYGMDEDGVLIFNAEAHPRGNLLDADPWKWEDSAYHFGYVDWGGGDPTACGIIGVSSSGRIHEFEEWHWEGSAPGPDRIGEWFIARAPKPRGDNYGYYSIECGKDEPNSVQQLREAGLPAVGALVARGEGITTMGAYLKSRVFTFNREKCPYSIAEFSAYFYDEKAERRTGEKFLTRTPSWTHADHKDGERYVCMRIWEAQGNRRDDWDEPVYELGRPRT